MLATMFTRRHLARRAAPLLLIGAAAAGARPPHRGAVPLEGLRYTLHVSMAPRAGGGLPLGMGNQDWTGMVVAANGRGRVDVTAGQAPGMWAVGDYLLFDSTEFVIVHPASREFVSVPADIATRSFEQMKANGIDVSVTGVSAALEPVAGMDSVAGRPAQHYKLMVKYALGMSAGAMQQSVQTQVTSDMWVARVPGMFESPFLRMSSSLGRGLMGEITAKVDSVVKPLTGSLPLRSVTVTQLSGALPTTVETEQRVEVSNLAPAAVNDSLLVLPQGFTAGTLPGASAPEPDSSGAKWRRPPRAGT